MLDNILDFLHGKAEFGARALKFLTIIAILYSLLGILVGVGYDWWWRAVYVVVGVGLSLMFFILRGDHPEEGSWWLFLGFTSPLILFLGAAYKPYGILLGLGLALIPWVLIAFGIATGTLVISAVGAAVSAEELPDAEKRAGSTFKGILGFVVWLWVAGLYVLKVGPYLTLELGMTLLFSAILLMLMNWAWNFGGVQGKLIAFVAVIGVFATTNALIFSEYAEETNFWDTRVWYTVQPFAHMFLLGVLPWLFFVWSQRMRPLKWLFGLAALFLFFRAGALTVLPVSAQEAFFGYNIATHVLLIDPMRDAWNDITESRRNSRSREVARVRKEIRDQKNPSSADWDAWKKKLERVARDFPEFSNPLMLDVGRNILDAQRRLWEGELRLLNSSLLATVAPTSIDIKSWKEDLQGIEDRYPEFRQEAFLKIVKDKIEEGFKKMTTK